MITNDSTSTARPSQSIREPNPKAGKHKNCYNLIYIFVFVQELLAEDGDWKSSSES